MDKKISKSYLDLADLVGDFIEYWGFKSVHGRIWTLIFLSKQPVNAKHLMENLKISKALVSMSIKDLLHYDVIHEVAKEGPSTQKYTYNPEIFHVITNVLKSRESVLLRKINEQIARAQTLKGASKNTSLESTEIGDGDNSICETQLEALSQMSRAAESTLLSLLKVGKVNAREILEVLSLN